MPRLRTGCSRCRDCPHVCGGRGGRRGRTTPYAMIDHVSIAVRDIKRAEAFYTAVLGPLGLAKLREWPDAAVGYGKKYPEFWINRRSDMTPVAQDSGVHICLRAVSMDVVD